MIRFASKKNQSFLEYIEAKYLSKLPDTCCNIISRKTLTIIFLITSATFFLSPLVIVNATTNYDNYEPQNYTLLNEAINETGNIPKYCDEYAAEIPWHIVTTVFGLTSIIIQIWTLWSFRDKIQNQHKTLKSWTGVVIDKGIGLIQSILGKIYRFSRLYRIVEFLGIDHGAEQIRTFSKNQSESMSDSVRGTIFFFHQLFFSDFTLSILFELLEMSYIGGIQDLLNRLGEEENLQDSRYIIRGLWFYSILHVNLIFEFLLFLSVTQTSDMYSIYRKYKLLIFGPLPVTNIIEYLCVERMGTADEISDNPVILANNIISIIFAIDIVMRLLDMLILSFDDFKLTLMELLPFLAGVVMIYSLCLRVYVNQRVSDPWFTYDRYMDDFRNNFTESHIESRVGKLYDNGYVEELAVRLEEEVDHFYTLYKNHTKNAPCGNDVCFLNPLTVSRGGQAAYLKNKWLTEQTLLFSIYKPWLNLPLKSEMNIYDQSSIENFESRKGHHPAYERYYYLINLLFDNVQNFQHFADKCFADVLKGITQYPGQPPFGDSPHTCFFFQFMDTKCTVRNYVLNMFFLRNTFSYLGSVKKCIAKKHV